LVDAGPYYPSGFKPVTLFADTKNVRAWPGGLGDCKVGGNYAPTIRPQQEAAKAGYAQVLWLFNDGEGDCATEVGTMNLFAFLRNEDGEDELVTPPLDGTILPGVTRDSVLQLAKEWGEFRVSERKLTMAELTKAVDEDRVRLDAVCPQTGFSPLLDQSSLWFPCCELRTMIGFARRSTSALEWAPRWSLRQLTVSATMARSMSSL
jgi:hypothetical protein